MFSLASQLKHDSSLPFALASKTFDNEVRSQNGSLDTKSAQITLSVCSQWRVFLKSRLCVLHVYHRQISGKLISVFILPKVSGNEKIIRNQKSFHTRY